MIEEELRNEFGEKSWNSFRIKCTSDINSLPLEMHLPILWFPVFLQVSFLKMLNKLEI
jgi:hypothetical protein